MFRSMFLQQLRRFSMKKIVVASAVMAAAAVASDIESRPAASVLTPAERSASLGSAPNISEKEMADWQRLREERRVARMQILQNLRENSAAEKNTMKNAIAPATAPVAAPEKPEANVPEMPKENFADEQKRNENEWMQKKNNMQPFGGRPTQFDPKQGNWGQPCPFDPRFPERNRKKNIQKRDNFEKGFPSR